MLAWVRYECKHGLARPEASQLCNYPSGRPAHSPEGVTEDEQGRRGSHHGTARMTRECPELEPIQDDEWLTQYGRRLPDGTPDFFTSPTAPEFVRPERCGRRPTANAMSVLRGRRTVEEATQAVCRRAARGGDGVRYATAGAFRGRNFTVEPDPTARMPEHSQVANLDITRPWTSDGSEECDARRFDGSFGEPIWWEGTT
jgi:hypothetical protein